MGSLYISASEVDFTVGLIMPFFEFPGAPSQPLIIEEKTMLGTEHMSYQLVWKVDSSIPIDDSVLRYRKVLLKPTQTTL